MRMSSLFLRTLRDDPADAEVTSHKLMVRAGLIRRVASGIYSWLPLGNRALRNVAQIVREEMDDAGAQEVTLPIAQPLDLWKQSGRDDAYGQMMFRVKDRKDNWYAMAPTAEEVVTTLVAGEYSSYRDLPVNLYQINWKYRDELRPRFGLLRAREFLMKDAYSFDADLAGLQASYDLMFHAYSQVFSRCGLTFRAVKAQSGEIGGDTSQEFMAVAAIGEDAFVWCEQCDYAANTEAATRRPTPEQVVPDQPPREVVHTPAMPGIDAVADHLGTTPDLLMKSIAFDVDGELVLVLVPGDREVNEYAVAGICAPAKVRLYTDADFDGHPEIPKGYIGPDFAGAARTLADSSLRAPHAWVTGANEADHHARNMVLGRDFTPTAWNEIVQVEAGDKCSSCGSPLRIDRGIEVGHVFQLGDKYSRALGAVYTDDAGAEHPMVMGCYGIGVSRILSAVIEEHHDDGGICWPAAIAPYQVHLVVIPGRGDNSAEVSAAAEQLYSDLRAREIDVLFDDRDVSPGVKFADADLLGMPVQVTIGAKGLARGVVERKIRATGDRDELALDVALDALTGH
ncbi:MAG: proline--tRNA ligase [Acidimicrobiia bacterium]|nr:proline--tRNA ligase [Acidimicrobiia bacterium]